MRWESQLVSTPGRPAPYAIQNAQQTLANAELSAHPARFLAVFGGVVCARTDHKRSVRYAARVSEQATHWIRVTGTIGHPEHAKNRGGRGVMGVQASIFRVLLGHQPPIFNLKRHSPPLYGGVSRKFLRPWPIAVRGHPLGAVQRKGCPTIHTGGWP